MGDSGVKDTGKRFTKGRQTDIQRIVCRTSKNPLGVWDALTFWRDSFNQLEPLKNNREELRKKIAQVAFGLRRYKETVDAVFALHDPGDGSPKARAKAKDLKAMRDRYQQTFDGFAQMLKQDIVQCVQTLR